MKTPYAFPEVELIENEYDQQVPIRVITEHVNNDFHNGNQIRTEKAISSVISRIHNDDEWYSRLEEKWLDGIDMSEFKTK